MLGGTKSNLTLREDAIGLRAHAEIDNPEVVQKAKEKRLRGWSFGFTNPTEERADRNGMPVRTISDLTLKEVSLIDDTMRPWYTSTTVETRAGERMEKKPSKSVQKNLKPIISVLKIKKSRKLNRTTVN